MTEKNYMSLALTLALRRKGLTHPNPTVGCVIVKDGEIVGVGNHEKAGLPHAEIVALNQAGEKAKGATMYLTLEPCTHWGRTPPCTDAIIRAGIRKVFVATTDPNPIIAGGGVRKLRSQGIEVEVGILEEEARLVNEDFFRYISGSRPYVTLKLAQSADGKIATAGGDSKWITSERARKFAHRLRMEATAVLIGVDTALRDDPLLTVRNLPSVHNPVRVVLDPDLRIRPDLKLIKDTSAPTVIFHRVRNRELEEKLSEKGAVTVCLEDFSLKNILQELHRREVVHLLVEGGAYTVTQFLKENLWDRLVLFTSPKIIGEGKTIGDLGIDRVSSAKEMRLRREIVLGDERVFEYVPVMEKGGLRW